MVNNSALQEAANTIGQAAQSALSQVNNAPQLPSMRRRKREITSWHDRMKEPPAVGDMSLCRREYPSCSKT